MSTSPPKHPPTFESTVRSALFHYLLSDLMAIILAYARRPPQRLCFSLPAGRTGGGGGVWQEACVWSIDLLHYLNQYIRSTLAVVVQSSYGQMHIPRSPPRSPQSTYRKAGTSSP